MPKTTATASNIPTNVSSSCRLLPRSHWDDSSKTITILSSRLRFFSWKRACAGYYGYNCDGGVCKFPDVVLVSLADDNCNEGVSNAYYGREKEHDLPKGLSWDSK